MDSDRYHPQSMRQGYFIERLAASSEAMLACMRLADAVATARVPVLLVGEAGSGKSLLARYLHFRSARENLPMAVLRCSELRENNVRARLLGSDETGGGIVRTAAGGTLVLDEVDQLNASVQRELLEVLREFSRDAGEGGGTGFAGRLGVRLLTLRLDGPRDNGQGKGMFANELVYGLGEMVLRIPPLRERREDIAYLAQLALPQANGDLGRAVKGLSNSAREFLLHYDFPGNVRELFRMMWEAVKNTRRDKIYVEDFGEMVEGEEGESSDAALLSLSEVEKRHIARVLLRTGWKRNAAARIMGISETMLNRKIRLYELERR